MVYSVELGGCKRAHNSENDAHVIRFRWSRAIYDHFENQLKTCNLEHTTSKRKKERKKDNATNRQQRA